MKLLPLPFQLNAGNSVLERTGSREWCNSF